MDEDISFPFSLPGINSSFRVPSETLTNSLPGKPLTESLGAQIGDIVTDSELLTEKPNNDEAHIFQRSEFTFLPQIAQMLELIESGGDKLEISKLVCHF
jgi:hypothetical protein